MDGTKLLEWVNNEIAEIKSRIDNGVHTEKMIYHGSLVQMELLRALITSGFFD